MSVDTGAMPNLPDPDTIHSDADLISSSGTRAAQSGIALVDIWGGIPLYYQAPEGALLYEAMNPVTTFTGEVSIVTYLVKAALQAFAEEVRAMKQEQAQLSAAAGVCYPDSTETDPDHGKNKEAEVTAGIAALAQRYAEAEETCAAAIRQADPAKVPDAPGFTGTLEYDVATTGADGLLQYGRRARVEILAGVKIPTLDFGTVFVEFADGTRVSFTRATLGSAIILLHYDGPGATLGTHGGIAHLPPGLKLLGKGLGIFGAGLSIYDNIQEQWNEDLINHPEYTMEQRIAYAARNVAFESGFSLGGSTLGGLGFAALGTLAFPGAGTVVGFVIGSILGGAAGEALGSYFQGVFTEGKDHGEAWDHALKEFWDSLW